MLCRCRETHDKSPCSCADATGFFRRAATSALDKTWSVALDHRLRDRQIRGRRHRNYYLRRARAFGELDRYHASDNAIASALAKDRYRPAASNHRTI